MPETFPFDAVAVTYDADFTHSLTGRLQRQRVWYFLQRDLPPRKELDILEVNCGTGEDARWLAAQGHRVWATDISPEMIRQARSKSSESIAFEVCGFSAVRERFKDRKFDVVFSNFAGLNCVDGETLNQLQADFASLLKPGGKFIGVFLGKKPLIERWYFRLKGQKAKVRRRMRQASVTLADGVEQETWFYTVDELKEIFSAFEFVRSRPVGLFIPPSYMESWAKRNRAALSLLHSLERLFGGIQAYSDRGDHVYIVNLQ